jgi:hypothetical protein
MSINGAKTGQSGISGSMRLIFQPFFAECSVNRPSLTRDGRPAAGAGTKTRKQPHAQ